MKILFLTMNLRQIFIVLISVFFLQTIVAGAQAMTVVESDHGKALVLDNILEKQSISVTGARVKDPFNWSPEVISKYRQQFTEQVENTFAGFTLSGIIWNSEDPMVVIDNTLLHIGDRVNGAIVYKITRDSVSLKKGIENHTLQFEELLFE